MNVRFAFLAGSVGLLSACNADVPTPSEPIAMNARFAAVVSSDNLSVPFTFSEFVPCANGGTGETVNLSGDLHVLIHQTVSASGEVVTKLQGNPQGISGIGEITGDKYQATGVPDDIEHGTGTFTFINNYRIIGRGPGNNLLVHQTLHVTVNANGNVTATVDNTRVDCK